MTSKSECDSAVFIVDDEAMIRDCLRLIVQTMGLSVQCFSSAREFIEFVEVHDVSGPACLITDLQMSEISGFGLLEQLRASGWEFPVIVMTGHGDEALRNIAEALGATFLEKPLRPAGFQETVATSLKRSLGEQDKL